MFFYNGVVLEYSISVGSGWLKSVKEQPMKSEEELRERLEYLKKWFEGNKEIKNTDYALYREMSGRLQELADALEREIEVEID
jgi:hypothetical protein